MLGNLTQVTTKYSRRVTSRNVNFNNSAIFYQPDARENCFPKVNFALDNQASLLIPRVAIYPVHHKISDVD